MMHVPDHLSVTGMRLIPVEHTNNLMSRIEAARSALLEQMSVPDHINVDGGARTVMPEVLAPEKSQVKMEVPSTLNVFHLTPDANQNIQTLNSKGMHSENSSDVINPYEAFENMRSKFVHAMDRLGEEEQKVKMYQRREKFLLLTLIGAAITIVFTNIRR